MTEFCIAEPAELAEVFRLRFQVFADEQGPHNWGAFERYRPQGEIPDEDPEEVLNFVAIVDGRIVGCSALRFWTAEMFADTKTWPGLDDLSRRLGYAVTAANAVECAKTCVHRDFRRRKLQTGLLQARAEEARRRGYKVLLAVVKADNAPSISALLSDSWEIFAEFEGNRVFKFLFKELLKGG